MERKDRCLCVERFNTASFLFIKILRGLLEAITINTFAVWLIGLTLSVTEYYIGVCMHRQVF